MLVQFRDPADCNQDGGTVWMFGYIDGVANPDPIPTIYPIGVDSVTIIFDEWYLEACDLCATGTNQIRNTFFTGNSEDPPEQILTITVASGETCALSPCPKSGL